MGDPRPYWEGGEPNQLLHGAVWLNTRPEGGSYSDRSILSLLPLQLDEEDEDDVLDFTTTGALEIYSIQSSGKEDAREIILEGNCMHGLPPDSIYLLELDPQRQKRQKVEKYSLLLRGPKYHLMLSDINLLYIHCKSGYIANHTFEVENDEVDKVLNLDYEGKFTVSYEWITSQARANFRFSFLAEDASTQHTIQNLNGSIQVSSLKQGTTRTLGLFHDDEFALISGEALPLLRSSAAFPAGEAFTLTFNLSYLVDGSPKKIIASKTFSSPEIGYGVYTPKGLDKARNDPKLHMEYVFEGLYPKLQMDVIWLTVLFAKSELAESDPDPFYDWEPRKQA